jgi:hypothetical protein
MTTIPEALYHLQISPIKKKVCRKTGIGFVYSLLLAAKYGMVYIPVPQTYR